MDLACRKGCLSRLGFRSMIRPTNGRGLESSIFPTRRHEMLANTSVDSRWFLGRAASQGEEVFGLSRSLRTWKGTTRTVLRDVVRSRNRWHDTADSNAACYAFAWPIAAG